MPKKIEKVKEKIRQAAQTLFETHGYAEVDMKVIAENAGIAVGTIYNYFPTKKQLFITTAKKGWEELFEELKKANILELSPKENLKSLMESLYRSSLPKRKMWVGFFSGVSQSYGYEIDELESFLQKLLKQLNNIFTDVILQIPLPTAHPLKGEEMRIGLLLMNTVISLLLEREEDTLSNLRFQNALVDQIFI